MSAQADLNAPLILREDQDGLVTLTLNRPRHYNALSEEMLAALKTELDAWPTTRPCAAWCCGRRARRFAPAMTCVRCTLIWARRIITGNCSPPAAV